MISTTKLYEQGRNYLTAEEIRAIANGKLKDYLARFYAPEEVKAPAFVDVETSNDDVQMLTKKVAYNPKPTQLTPNE